MARFRRSVFASILVALASCTTGGVGGGGGLIATGGIAGTPCAAAQAKGCLVQGSSASIMVCGTDGKWSLLASCTAGQYCSETYVGGIANPQCLGGAGADVASGGDSSSASGSDASDSGGSGSDTGANDTGPKDTGPNDIGQGDTGQGDSAKPVEVCGDGNCAGGETDLGCPADCAKKAVCGNNLCEVGESTGSCPGDCKSSCEPMCTGKQCGSNGCGGVCGSCGPGKACTDEGLCVAVGAICGNANCESGETSGSCPADCGLPSPVCGDGKCEGGETTANCKTDCPASGPVCGDGKCEIPEDNSICEIDCPATGGSCVGKCGVESTGCMCDDQCAQYGDCCGDYQSACGGGSCTPKCAAGAICGSDDGCGGKCAGGCAAGLVCNSSKVCVPSSAKCGNGTCETGENATNCAADCKTAGASCNGMCGKASGSCYCDTQCKSSGDCCADYDKYCGGSSGPVCGNGTCESGETTANCAADCKTASGSCNGMCGKASGSCYCDSQCKSSGDCCADYDKYCGGSSGPVCGNGMCESGESASNCSKDCGGSSSMCPNGKCEAGETEASCPQDCKLGCFGDFSLGSTFYKSGDTKQTGLACDNKAMPKNCPDGYWITFPDTGDCVCILSCAGIGVSVGQNCTTDGAWKCQDILATNASANGGKMCVPTKWGLCTK